jgi:RimJ/RimL family protein N-acetyltransferase
LDFSCCYWGQGFATEAATASRDYRFDVLDADRLISIINPENLRSRRVAERIGRNAVRDHVRRAINELTAARFAQEPACTAALPGLQGVACLDFQRAVNQ